MKCIQHSEYVLGNYIVKDNYENARRPSYTHQTRKKEENAHCLLVAGTGRDHSGLLPTTNGVDNCSQNNAVVNERYSHRDIDTTNKGIEGAHPTSSRKKDRITK